MPPQLDPDDQSRRQGRRRRRSIALGLALAVLVALIFYVLTIVKMGARHLPDAPCEAVMSSTPPRHQDARRNNRLALLACPCGAPACSAWPMPPCRSITLFCAATGYGGTTQRAAGNPKGVIAREMTTRFDANVDRGLPMAVTPAKPVDRPDRQGRRPSSSIATNIRPRA